MRLLVGLHHLELGGSQLNALDFALAMREHGHDVAVFGVHTGVPGPVAEMVQSAGLPVTLVRHPVERHRAVVPYRRAVARGLTAAAKAHRADLVHVYEFPLALDAFDGPHLRLGLPVVVTIYGMAVPRWLPRYPELIVGTQELVDEATTFRAPPTLIEPPVDTDTDDSAMVDGQAFRHALGIRDDELLLGVVSRLEPDMKAEGILRAMAALRRLDDDRLRLVVVGTGPSAGDLHAEAARVNEALGRPAVLLPGALEDPRPAYAAMDIALGMGGSALRAMSFGRPLIVLGLAGFSRECTPQTLDNFLTVGFWGTGGGDLDDAPLAEQIRVLAADPARRASLGGWSRRLVVERFSLKTAADKLAEVYARALVQHPAAGRRLGEATRAAVHKAAADMLPESIRQRLRRVRA
ncbi:glycosyltransferase family 4 protein [Micromonospora sp. CPCC 206061]|uniref:glycosyltransferase family 4 protein n=1 Tax=Micromonospora sp. CPCC 206061 TaxID=3122410 RepID=UPI002FEF5E79